MKQAKPILIMIPGLICDENLFVEQIDALGDELDIKVVVHARDVSLAELAGDILDMTDEPFYLFGLSMGGYIAFEVMRQAIKRGQQQRIKKLVLSSTSARLDPPDMKKRRIGFMELAKKGKFKGMSVPLMRTFIHPDKMADKTVTGTIYDMAESTGPRGFIFQTNMILDRPDSREDLKKISCPTLVMCGVDDERTPLYLSQEMAQLIPNAELVSFENCGHLPPLEVPEQVNKALMNFLLQS